MGMDRRLTRMERHLQCARHEWWLSCSCDREPWPAPEAFLTPAELERFDDLLARLHRAAGPTWQAEVERWGDCPVCRTPRTCRMCETAATKRVIAALPMSERRELRQYLLQMYPDAGTPEEREAFLARECEESS